MTGSGFEPEQERGILIGLAAVAVVGLALICALVLGGCASAPPALPPVIPTLPPPGDVEQLIPSAPVPIEVPANLPRFPDQHVAADRCPGLPEGILTSRAAYAERITLMAQGRRCAAEAKALHQLRKEERAAAADLEAAYRARTAELERSLQQERRLAPWRLWGGVAIGAAGMLAATWAAGRALR